MSGSQVLGAIGAVIAIVLVVAIVFALVTMWAWNITMPYLFGLPEVSLLQAFALNLLAGALIKSSSFSAGRK